MGLAAVHLRHVARGDALMAVLPADHYIEQPQKFLEVVNAALDAARQPGRMVVLGIPPTRPETGFGYIERTGDSVGAKGFPVLDRKSTRLNSSHLVISYAVFCL